MQVLSLEIMMAKNRTFNTLFMLSSVDGKISTGCVDGRDFDKDFPKINGLKEGLKQYYQLEQSTDINSFNTGRVMVKIGMNDSGGLRRFCPLSNRPCLYFLWSGCKISNQTQ